MPASASRRSPSDRHLHRAHARAARGLDVALVVADQERCREVDVPVLRGAQDQARLRLAARAAVFVAVRADVERVDVRADLAQPALRVRVDRVDVGRGHQAARDAALVGDHEHEPALVVEPPHALARAREPLELGHRLDVVVGGRAPVQHAVAVEESGASRRIRSRVSRRRRFHAARILAERERRGYLRGTRARV